MESIKFYFHNLGLYDYIGFGVVGVVFILFLMLSLVVIFKKPTFGVLLLLFTFAVPPLGVFGVHKILQESIRKSKLYIKKVEPLHFSNALLIDARIDNLSKKALKKCYIEFKIIKKDKNSIKNLLYSLKPLATRTIYIHKTIQAKGSYGFKKILQDTTYKNDDELLSKIACY